MTSEEAIEVLRYLDDQCIWQEDCIQVGGCNHCKEAINMAIEALKDRPQGKWIKTSDGDGWNDWYVFKCPLCGATIEDRQYRSWEYNFCPNCGAKMKGGAE